MMKKNNVEKEEYVVVKAVELEIARSSIGVLKRATASNIALMKEIEEFVHNMANPKTVKVKKR
jgi:hypothetical protein